MDEVDRMIEQVPGGHGWERMDRPVIRTRSLSFWFGAEENRKQVLFDVNLEVWPGELIIMTGPSGSGKTTLLTLIGALRSVQTGYLEVLGHQMRGMNNLQRAELRRQIGFIFQAHNLFESLTAFQNVRMALEVQERPAEEMRTAVTQILNQLGLGQRIHYKPQSLSGGPAAAGRDRTGAGGQPPPGFGR